MRACILPVAVVGFLLLAACPPTVTRAALAEEVTRKKEAGAEPAEKKAEKEEAKKKDEPSADGQATSKRGPSRAKGSAGRAASVTPTRARRMPKHYEELELDDSQEAKVCSIQTHYRSESQKLRERLSSLASSRDQQLAAVLKPAQRKKLEELVAAAHEAKARKKAVAGDTAPAKGPAKTSAS